MLKYEWSLEWIRIVQVDLCDVGYRFRQGQSQIGERKTMERSEKMGVSGCRTEMLSTPLEDTVEKE